MTDFNIGDRAFETLRSMHRISEESAQSYLLCIRCLHGVRKGLLLYAFGEPVTTFSNLSTQLDSL